jgi:hypothetical protein
MDEEAHGTPEFLPWHRWYTYQFETALRSVADDPCITLPYWDWEQDSGAERDSVVFDRTTFGGMAQDCNWETTSGECLRRFNDDRFEFWSIRRVLGMVANFDQYTDDFGDDSDRSNGFRAALEGGCHAVPHQFIGADMNSMRSPNDPLFFLHHANVDRIWAIWQDWTGQSQMSRNEFSVPEHYEGSGLDSPLPFPSQEDVAWDFRLGGDDYPTPRDIMSNDDIIHVRYAEDQMARLLAFDANPGWFQAASSSSIDVVCDSATRRSSGRKLLAGHHETPVEDNASFPVASLRGRSSNGGMLSYFKNELEQEEDQIDVPPMTSFSEDGISSSHYNITSLESCLEFNGFSREDDREDWDRLCEDLPLTATYAERLAKMAQDECQRKGNPFGATRQWIENMKMTDEVVTFECFHLPDRKDG